jgi:hypothetical protein
MTYILGIATTNARIMSTNFTHWNFPAALTKEWQQNFENSAWQKGHFRRKFLRSTKCRAMIAAMGGPHKDFPFK